MTAWLVAIAAAVVVVGVVVSVSARRRVAAREARRVEQLGLLAERLQASLGEFRATKPPPPGQPRPARHGGEPPLVADRLPGRAALLEAVDEDVARARSGKARLTAVVVRIADDTTPAALVDAVREVTGRPAYAVGPTAAAFTLPGLGRAGGLGALARIESMTPSSGRAVEWEPEESAVELVARLLGSAAPG